MGRSGSSATVRHPLFARMYARLADQFEERGAGELRDEALAGLSGRVVEVGAGTGINFGHYPGTVTEVVAVEPEPYLREIASRAADAAPPLVTVVEGVADALPLDDVSCDAGVASLVLCSVPDQAVALGELLRVIRPGGELRFFEHVRADTPRLARVQRLLDATVWPAVGGGCHAHRDTRTAIEDAGFTIKDLEALRIPDTRIPGPTSPHILGIATTKEG